MQRPIQTRLSLVQTVDPISSGRAESSSFSKSADSVTRPSAASSVARRNASSAEILRARDILRDVLLREDETEEIVLLGKVSEGLNQMLGELDSLAGLQMMFESWVDAR